LKPSDLTLGQVVIKRVAVVELGVNNGSGDGGGCFGIEVWAVQFCTENKHSQFFLNNSYQVS